MAIYTCKQSRRQFLVGSGKTLLALPLLPSLLPQKALAQAVPIRPRLMLLSFQHNSPTHMWPNKNLATQNVGSLGVKRFRFSNTGRLDQLTTVFEHSLYESLRNQDLVTFIRGLHIKGERGGGAHGNYVLRAGAGEEDIGNFPSIDTIIEKSRSLYPASTPDNVIKAIRAGDPNNFFYDKVGGRLQGLDGTDHEDLYNKIFSKVTSGTTAPQDLTNQLKTNILNRVYESYRSARSSRKISSQDIANLEQTMSLISDAQASFSNNAAPVTCDNKPSAPGNLSARDMVNNNLRLMAIAFRCGLSQFGYFSPPRVRDWVPGLSFEGNAFHTTIHGTLDTDQQRYPKQREAYQRWWAHMTNVVAEHFLTPLNVEEGSSGRTYLENMVTGLLCPGGIHDIGDSHGHRGTDNQQILIGSMGGKLDSGYYYSYPQRARNRDPRNAPYNCFLITLLHLMGIQPSEYAYATGNGRGLGYYAESFNDSPFGNRIYGPLTEMLRS